MIPTPLYDNPNSDSGILTIELSDALYPPSLKAQPGYDLKICRCDVNLSSGVCGGTTTVIQKFKPLVAGEGLKATTPTTITTSKAHVSKDLDDKEFLSFKLTYNGDFPSTGRMWIELVGESCRADTANLVATQVMPVAKVECYSILLCDVVPTVKYEEFEGKLYLNIGSFSSKLLPSGSLIEFGVVPSACTKLLTFANASTPNTRSVTLWWTEVATSIAYQIEKHDVLYRQPVKVSVSGETSRQCQALTPQDLLFDLHEDVNKAGYI